MIRSYPGIEETYQISGTTVEVVGHSFDSHPHKILYYDILCDGEVVNVGWPLLRKPTIEDIVVRLARRFGDEPVKLIMRDVG